MESLRDILAFLLSLFAQAASPAAKAKLSDLSLWLLPDTPRLAGAWVIRFRDPLPRGGSEPRLIDATLCQFGRRAQGSRHIQGDPGDPFEYRGWIRRNAFYGEFRRKNKSILAGTGTFVLKIAADGQAMEGRCGWYDSDLDEVWNSSYLWQRDR